mmetsp:Transcript_11579/g.26950  ORF Transcript_11579/g.26950 Transcript_11579/m.26950 type:complete len:750 (+) Transcript_11579:132-2381(+)
MLKGAALGKLAHVRDQPEIVDDLDLIASGLTTRRERIAQIIEDAVTAIECEFGVHAGSECHSPAPTTATTLDMKPRAFARTLSPLKSKPHLPASLSYKQDTCLRQASRSLDHESQNRAYCVDDACMMSSDQSQTACSEGEHSRTSSVLGVDENGNPKAIFKLMPEWDELRKVHAEANQDTFGEKLNFANAGSLWSNATSLSRSESGSIFIRPKRPRLIMHPSSPFRVVWDCLACLFLAYDFYVIPLTSVFGVRVVESSPAIFYPSLTALIYWSVDVLLSCMLGYHLSDGQVELNVWKVLRRYVRTWFFPEIFILAADWLNFYAERLALGESGVGAASRYIRLLRLLRYARLIRLRKLLRAVDTLQTHSDILESTSLLLGISRNLFFIFYLNHGIASAWYWLGLKHMGDGGWLAGRLSDDWFRNYIMALHWSIANFTPGSSSTSTEATAEIAFQVLILFFALVVFSVFVSSTTSLISSLVRIKGIRQQKMWRLKRFLLQHEFPAKLKDRVLRYCLRALENRRDFVKTEEVELLNLLSKPLRQEVHSYTKLATLKQHPFLRRLSHGHAALMHKICTEAVSEVVFSKGDLIFTVGEATEKMSIIVTGVLGYSKAARPDIEGVEKSNPAPWSNLRLTENQCFCEPAIWVKKWHCRGTMTAEDDSQILDLSSHAFQRAIASHHIASRFACRYAVAFIDDLNTTALSDYGNDTLSDLHCFVAEAEVKSVMGEEPSYSPISAVMHVITLRPSRGDE